MNSVPRLLLCLISNLIDGNSGSENGFSQEVLTVAQIIMTHHRKSSKKVAQDKAVVRRHSKTQETPVMIYCSLKLYSITRSRNIIDCLFQLGLCISYDRILEITKSIYENLRQSYELYKCFFPNTLMKGLLLLKDNIDVNARSNFIQSHYHGTSISMIQFRTNEDAGTAFPDVDVSKKVKTNSKKLSPLPADYINVKKLFSDRKKDEKLWAPMCNIIFCDITEFKDFEGAFDEEVTWLDTVSTLLQNYHEQTEIMPPGWAEHHSTMSRGIVQPPGINTISPLLRDKVATLNTQGHCMLMNTTTTNILNPGQTPVDTSDQPVYALSKELQFRYPNIFGNYMPLFGGLHIEQSLLVIHGQLINGSGLMEILNLHKFSTIGVSAVVDVSSIKRATYCIQVTLCALYVKVKEAAAENNATDRSPYEWLCQKSIESDMCFYWKIVINFQINYLIFVRSEREGNFKLYVVALRRLIKWYFIFDKYNYSRWLSVHLFDLMTLEAMYPDVYENLLNGCFSFQKKNRKFSRMALDQVHEQNNRTIKSCGGATDLVNKVDDSALIRWETCGPDVARLLGEFEQSMKNDISPAGFDFERHHEDSPSFRESFSSDVKTLCKGMHVNPFMQNKLMKINNSTMIPDIAFVTIKKMEDRGEEQFLEYVRDRMVHQKVSICETIPKNNFDIWQVTETTTKKPFTPSNSQINKMRSACEHRSQIAQELFKNEILNVPQSLSVNVESMYHGSKSDITKRLPSCSTKQIPTSDQESAIIIEMSPLIRAKCFAAKDIACFSDFAVLIYYEVLKLGTAHQRIDLVFDRYFDNSLKEDTRKNRGSAGSTFIFDNNTNLPNDMTDTFTTNSKNKNALNEYLAEKLIEIHQGSKLLITTFKNTVLCSSSTEPINLPETSIINCQSEEADQRLIRHFLHCLADHREYKQIVIRTIDTDVLILLISCVSQFYDMCSDVEIYAEMVNSHEYYNIMTAAETLGKETCYALPFFYAFTGCDIVSSFYTKGKCKAWDAWKKSVEVDSLTNVFGELGNRPSVVTSEQIDLLEKFVLDLYSLRKTSTLAQGRLEKFCMSSDNDLRKLPPGRDALVQHIKRACLQSGYLWRESIEDFQLPDPTLWGWIRNEDGSYRPLWESQTGTVDFDKFVMTCSCAAQKCKTCKCSKANVTCIAMCGCGRKCVDK